MEEGIRVRDGVAVPALEALLGVIARLRGEGGCPWDRKQTLETLKPFLLEESYELLEALDAGDPTAHRDEMGDVLLQILLQSRIREEEGLFDFDAVAGHLRDKLIRRHPHVFGDVEVDSAEDVIRNWNAIKADERLDQPPRKTLEGIPLALPALHRAQRVQERAARRGFDWNETGAVLDKIEEELGEVREALAAGDAGKVQEELGDLLFAAVNLCRFQKVDAEGALRQATAKFGRRFDAVEARLCARGVEMDSCDLARLDREWEAVKAEEASRPPSWVG